MLIKFMGRGLQCLLVNYTGGTEFKLECCWNPTVFLSPNPTDVQQKFFVEFVFALRNSKLFRVPGLQKSTKWLTINTATPTASKTRLSTLNNRQWPVGTHSYSKLLFGNWLQLVGRVNQHPTEVDFSWLRHIMHLQLSTFAAFLLSTTV